MEKQCKKMQFAVAFLGAHPSFEVCLLFCLRLSTLKMPVGGKHLWKKQKTANKTKSVPNFSTVAHFCHSTSQQGVRGGKNKRF